MPECVIVNGEDTEEYIKKKGLVGIEEFLKGQLEKWKDVEINIGVTGDGGVGKSSFINAIRGLEDDDKGAAETGVIATTRKAAIYYHPINNKIKFWDLPGIGTPNYPDLETYCKKVDFEKYDTFLILTAGRFTENNLQLARKVKSITKSFFFVRTKIDNDIHNESRKKAFNEESTLKAVREDCWKNLEGLTAGDTEVFLISNHETANWDFDCLTQAILDALPVHQKESLTLSLTSPSRDLIKRKVEVLRGRIWKVAGVSATVAAVPVPGLSVAFDVGLLIKEINFYKFQLGIPDENSKGFQGTTSEVILKMKHSFSAYVLGSTAEEFARFIPLLGSPIAGSLSFASTYMFLHECLKEVEEAALTFLEETSSRVVDELHSQK